MEPITYETGEAHGYLMGHPDHPMNVEVEVLPGRYFNGPDGAHVGPGSRIWRAEVEIEPNRSIFLPLTSPEYKARANKIAEVKREAMKAKKAEKAL